MSYCAGRQAAHDALPQLLAAGLGAPQALEKFVELHNSPGGQVEGVASCAHDVDKLVVVRVADVVDALMSALDEPAAQPASLLLSPSSPSSSYHWKLPSHTSH